MNEHVVNKLIKNNETISIMESCTGGYISNLITNIQGASSIFMFSAITYNNEYKIKFGVNPKTIDKYSVYSINVAREMSKSIQNFTQSTYSVGITGLLGTIDPNNEGNINDVFISIYNSKNKEYTDIKLKLEFKDRVSAKNIIADKLFKSLFDVIS